VFWFLCKVLAHRASLPWSINDAFRMLTPKRFCHMAAPANWQMRAKNFWEFFRNLIPLHGFLFGAQQRGPVIMP
jgi:hypothetical protein